MRYAWLPRAAFVAFFIFLVPNPGRAPAKVTTPLQVESRPEVVGRRALVNLESWVADMISSQRNRSAAGQNAGNLWMEVNQLKRSGQDVRRIEWQVSELEESFRNNGKDAPTRRHIVNNLELEIQLLKQRSR
jgi:hypothetical protein